MRKKYGIYIWLLAIICFFPVITLAQPMSEKIILEVDKNVAWWSGVVNQAEKLPDELLFSAPQYNTWIELMYDQNQEDVPGCAHLLWSYGYPYRSYQNQKSC